MPDVTLLTSEFLPFRGGIGTVALGLANAASELGEEVAVIAPDYGQGAATAEDDRLPFQVRRYPAGPYSKWQTPRYVQAALTAARDRQSGDLVAVDAPFVEALALTRPIHGRRFDAILHGSEILKATQSRMRRMLRVHRAYAAAERLFANSAYTRDLALAAMPALAGKPLAVAPLGVERRWFGPADPQRIRERLGLGNRRLIVTTGRITPRKGQVSLLRALGAMEMPKALCDTLGVVIAGRATGPDAVYAEEVNAAARALAPLPVLVRDDLTDDDLRDLYAAADLFCLPGSARNPRVIEGFGLVFLEAAAQGLPALAGRVGGVPEAVLDGQTGCLVPPDDPAALGQALGALLSEPGRLAALGAAARSHAERHSWTAFAEIVRARP